MSNTFLDVSEKLIEAQLLNHTSVKVCIVQIINKYMKMKEELQIKPSNHNNESKSNYVHPASIIAQKSDINQEKEKSTRFDKIKRYWNILNQKQEHRNKKSWEKDKQYFKKILELSLQDQVLNRSLGAIFGATIGDALGAYCEFFHKLDDKVVDQAMKMEGGGTFGLEAGQFTDDSELATHLLTGLLAFKAGEEGLTEKEEKRIICNIGLQYVKWMKGDPFDIGCTIRVGISSLQDYRNKLEQVAKQGIEKTQFMKQMFEKIYYRNMISQANGSLMRISPMASFFALIKEDPLKHIQFIKGTYEDDIDEIRLTHPNKILTAAGACWVNILYQLITRKDNEINTFVRIIQSNMSHREFTDLKEWEQVKSWFKEAQQPIEAAMNSTPNMGHAKIGFTYGLRVLYYISREKNELNDKFYIDWMRWVIGKAGDTDTNGAIAGGLMGSVIGFWDLPQTYVARSLKTITDSNKFDIDDDEPAIHQKNQSKYNIPQRPSFYQPSNVLLTALKLIGKCRHFDLNEDLKQ